MGFNGGSPDDKASTIKAEFNLLLRSQMPTMLIYAKIAAEYGISEERVRKIIRSP